MSKRKDENTIMIPKINNWAVRLKIPSVTRNEPSLRNKAKIRARTERRKSPIGNAIDFFILWEVKSDEASYVFPEHD